MYLSQIETMPGSQIARDGGERFPGRQLAASSKHVGLGGGGHDVKVGDSEPGMGVTGELTPCALLSMVSSEKRRFQRCVNLDPQNDEQDRLGAKVSLSLERPRAWDVTPHQDLPAQAFVIGSPREVTFHRGPCSSTL